MKSYKIIAFAILFSCFNVPLKALTWNEFWEPFVEHASHNSRIRNKTEYCYKVVKYEEYVPGNEFSSGYVRHRSEKHTIHCPY